MYLTHAPRPDAPDGTDPHSHWTRLEVLDAQTLETVGALDIDTQGKIEESADGRLVISIPDALLFVDVRQPARPTARAAVPYPRRTQVIANNNQIYLSGNNTQHYPVDLQNLVP